MRERTAADDIVQKAYNKALLSIVLPSMTSSASSSGYNLVSHGTMNKLIQLILIPWKEELSIPDVLIGGLINSINESGAWCVRDTDIKSTTNSSHKKVIYLTIWCGEKTARIELTLITNGVEDTSHGIIPFHPIFSIRRIIYNFLFGL